MNITESVVTKVETTHDSPGWVIYFNDNKLFIRLKAKYKVEPAVGDNIRIYGFPRTTGVELNGKLIFKEHKSNATKYYAELNRSINHCMEVEKALKRVNNPALKDGACESRSPL